ncbi:MAG: RsbRD N-terminal domain-containing protein [Desulfomonilaceae bacterium]|nr:RsbRD N-terminal domain-containing protein [Desulfomonilaceae bacterium]
MSQTLEHLLLKKRSAILKRWLDLIFDTYPADGRSFFASRRNRIANPVGGAIVDGVDKLFDWLMQGEKSDVRDICVFLDNIVRIRAVQEFSASHSIGFVFFLKHAIRETLDSELRKEQLHEDLLTFESKIDSLALLAFDNYSQCREQLHQIRAAEIRNRTSRLLERACQKYGMPSEW